MRHWKKALFGILVTVLALWWALADVVFAEVWANIRLANFWLLLASTFVATFGFLIRALRWKILLTPVKPDTSLRSRFAGVSIGFMANNILPARVGEFLRAYAFSRLERVTASAAFGTLVVERVMDAVILLSFLVIPVLTPGFPSVGGLSGWVGGAAFAVVGVMLLLIVMAMWPRHFVSVGSWIARLLPRSVAGPVTDGLESFVEPLAIVRDPRLLFLAFAWSLFFWTWHGLSFWLGMLAFGIDTGFVSAIFTEAVVGFGVAVPSAPGFFGTFHAAAKFALSDVYGVEEAASLAFAFGYHFAGWIPITVIGLWYAWKLGLSLSEVGSAEESVEGGAEGEGPDAGLESERGG